MAGGHALCVCFLAALVVNQVRSQSVSDSESGPLMRRHKSTQVHLGPGGEMKMHHDPVQQPVALMQKRQRQPGEVPWCDLFYPLGPENSNTCTGVSQKIDRMEDCRHAGAALNLTFDEHNFSVTDDEVNPNPRPKECFQLDGQVFFNPTDSSLASVKDSLKGTPICTDLIYTNGTNGATTSADLCGAGYELIKTWKECSWAHDCQFGGMYCEEVLSSNADYTSTKAVPGCFRNALGCFGFNSPPKGTEYDAWLAKFDATWNTTATTPVCRKIGNVFAGHPAFTTAPPGNSGAPATTTAAEAPGGATEAPAATTAAP